MDVIKKNFLPEMEGFRGFASLWVFIGHICILVQCNIPIVNRPDYGVDLFVLLSGFLMVKNYIERRDIEPWNNINTVKKFWIRRFFRIAPIYYVFLIVAIFFGPSIGYMRDVIYSYYPTTATVAERFNDQSIKNIVIHISLLFGMSPSYSFRTTLPDWSIGLEVQYYLLLPLIMALCKKINIKIILLITSGMSTSLFFIMPDFYNSFTMPSFILLKLPVFISGMLVYIAVKSKKSIFLSLPIIAILFASITGLHIDRGQLSIQIAMCFFIFYVLTESKCAMMIRLKKAVRWLLNNKVSTWLGDVSYSVYLIHLLIVTPVIAIMLQSYEIFHLHSIVRLLIVFSICTPLVYGLAFICFRFIEKPGILIGRGLLKKYN